jgi:hypothetical protein
MLYLVRPEAAGMWICGRCLLISISEVEYRALTDAERADLNDYLDEARGRHAAATPRVERATSAAPAANPVETGLHQ